MANTSKPSRDLEAPSSPRLRFSELPAEIRCMIWHSAASEPQDLTCTCNFIYYTDKKGRDQSEWVWTATKKLAAATKLFRTLMSICHESRQEVKGFRRSEKLVIFLAQNPRSHPAGDRLCPVWVSKKLDKVSFEGTTSNPNMGQLKLDNLMLQFGRRPSSAKLVEGYVTMTVTDIDRIMGDSGWIDGLSRLLPTPFPEDSFVIMSHKGTECLYCI